jgi:hypothetical protein
MRKLMPSDVDGKYLRCKGLKAGEFRLEPLQRHDNPAYDESLLAVHAHGQTVRGNSLLFGMSRQHWDRKMKLMCKTVGIPRTKAHWHALRHATAMIVFKGTLSLGSVRQALRHRSWSACLVYLNESDAGRAHEAMAKGIEGL